MKAHSNAAQRCTIRLWPAVAFSIGISFSQWLLERSTSPYSLIILQRGLDLVEGSHSQALHQRGKGPTLFFYSFFRNRT